MRSRKPSTTETLFWDQMEKHKSEFVRLARNVLIDAGSVEDLLQQATLKAYQRFPEAEIRNFRGWFSSFVVNMGMNFNSRLKRSRRHFVPYEQNDLENMPEEPRPAELDYSLIEDKDALYDLISQDIRHGLEELSELERTCFLLRVVEGFSYAEIAQFHQIPDGTVASHISRARSKLQIFLRSSKATDFS